MSPVQVPRVGVLDTGHEPLTPQGEAPYLWRPSLLYVPIPGRDFWQDHISDCPTPFILCCGRAVQLVSRSFSEEIVPYVAEDLVSSWEVWYSVNSIYIEIKISGFSVYGSSLHNSESLLGFQFLQSDKKSRLNYFLDLLLSQNYIFKLSFVLWISPLLSLLYLSLTHSRIFCVKDPSKEKT